MKLFLDTNVILENLLEREEFSTVHRLFKKLQEMECTLFISVGSFYTMIFLVDKYLRKELLLAGDLRIAALRQIMLNILKTVRVAEHDNESLLQGVLNPVFSDMEDGCQYEVAKRIDCDILLTFNAKDFPLLANNKPQVLTPQEFLDSIV